MIQLQLYTIIFCIVLALYSKVPCQVFNFYGITSKRNKFFHGASMAVRAVFAIALSAAAYGFSLKALYCVSILGTWCWIAFDVALAIILHGWRYWGYLGTTSNLDVKIQAYLKKNAGKKKAIILLVLILVANYFLYR